jgi:hypothetical protein
MNMAHVEPVPEAALLARARGAGLTLRVEDDRLALSGPKPSDDPLAALQARRDDLILMLKIEAGETVPAPAVVPPTQPIDASLGDLPSAPCPACRTVLWWRMSAMSRGPGPWCCLRCARPDPADWIDACAILIARSK